MPFHYQGLVSENITVVRGKRNQINDNHFLGLRRRNINKQPKIFINPIKKVPKPALGSVEIKYSNHPYREMILEISANIINAFFLMLNLS